jgi:hypothetical protein
MAGDDGPVLQTCHTQEPARWGGEVEERKMD